MNHHKFKCRDVFTNIIVPGDLYNIIIMAIQDSTVNHWIENTLLNDNLTEISANMIHWHKMYRSLFIIETSESLPHDSYGKVNILLIQTHWRLNA